MTEEEERALGFVREWIDLLASGQLREAMARLSDDGLTEEEVVRILYTYVENTMLPRAVNMVPGAWLAQLSDPNSDLITPIARMPPPHVTDWEVDTSGSEVWVDHVLPVRGEWSPITAEFRYRETSGRPDVTLVTLGI